jgi:hypothetical protein
MYGLKAQEPYCHYGYENTLIAFLQASLWKAQQDNCEQNYRKDTDQLTKEYHPEWLKMH